ncbi:hypothetical protein E2C01_039491 [Portunus trituberculatus]|uniref:Uncharacterized protein n=1 Tax=Portunus trituberculatus TaxID=210409 RepID=A0A5B7FK01_PORTR|nr:hypothetical protein [Portunus trituberculatus]
MLREGAGKPASVAESHHLADSRSSQPRGLRSLESRVVRRVAAKFELKSPSVHLVVCGHLTTKSEFRQAEICQMLRNRTTILSELTSQRSRESSGEDLTIEWSSSDEEENESSAPATSLLVLDSNTRSGFDWVKHLQTPKKLLNDDVDGMESTKKKLLK